MKILTSPCRVWMVVALTLATIATALQFGFAQDTTANNANATTGQHKTHGQSRDLSLADQLRTLQTKVAELEAALKRKHGGEYDRSPQATHQSRQTSVMSNAAQRQSGMQMGTKKSGMSGRMGSMSVKGMAGMENMPMMSRMSGKGMSGMAMMGQMKGLGQMRMPSELPGFAGASHIYHIGATSFFLDHPQHITLTQEQRVKLNHTKEKVLLGQATFDRWISQAEQELWVLTSSEAPEVAKIEAKIREIEKLGSDKRITYIRAVGEAARILTDEQRLTLVGNLPPDHGASGTGDKN